MPSLWLETCTRESFPSLNKDLKTDVLIVGGGLCGLLCAWKLKRAGVKCALVEADVLCGGITQNTTAKITAQHGLIYQRLVKEFGTETARLYYEANAAAVEEYRALCQNIDCDFEDKDNYIYSRTDRAPLDREMDALEQLGIPAGPRPRGDMFLFILRSFPL